MYQVLLKVAGGAQEFEATSRRMLIGQVSPYGFGEADILFPRRKGRALRIYKPAVGSLMITYKGRR